MEFEEAHAIFIESHLRRRQGERRGRLERGHGHGEKLFLKNVWWRLRGHFDNLHPEYEVTDWRGRSYFADFVWILGLIKVIIEIKGYASHVRDMDRMRFSNELNRETFLTAMGYRVISFSYDDIEQRPELCVALLRMVLSQFQLEEKREISVDAGEDQVLRLAIELAKPIRPVDLTNRLGVDPKTAVKRLRALHEKGWFTPVRRGSGKRVVQYQLVMSLLEQYMCKQ